VLGVYSSREIAEKEIESKYKKLPGFREPDGKFTIDEYTIDRGDCEEGFLTTYPPKSKV